MRFRIFCVKFEEKGKKVESNAGIEGSFLRSAVHPLVTRNTDMAEYPHLGHLICGREGFEVELEFVE